MKKLQMMSGPEVREDIPELFLSDESSRITSLPHPGLLLTSFQSDTCPLIQSGNWGQGIVRRAF